MNLIFKTKLHNNQGEIHKEIPIAVEFLNIDTRKWEQIEIEAILYKEGSYHFEYEIPSRIYGDQPTLRKIRDIVQEGGMPIFRLITKNSKDQVHILSNQGKYTILQEDILCDFMNLYLLDIDHIIDLNNPDVTSVTIANSTLNNDMGLEVKELHKEIEILQQELDKVTSNYSGTIILEKPTEEVTHNEVSIDMAEMDKASSSAQHQSNEQVDEVVHKEEQEKVINELSETLDTLESKLIENNAIIDVLQSEKEVLEQTISQQEDTVQQQQQQINEHIDQSSNQKGMIQSLEAEKEMLENQLNILSEEHIDQEYIPRSVSANKLYTDVIDEIQIAKNNTINADFKLSNVSINLKTVVEEDNEGLRFQVIDMSSAESIQQAALSDIKIDISENQSQTISNDLIVPKLTGLTETAARKYLEKFNLRLDPVYQYLNINNSNFSEGQAFRQSPEPGTEITPESSITVIFVKNNQLLN